MNKNLKWVFATIAILAVVLFFTNPDQAAHLKAIQDTRRLRNPKADTDSVLLRISDYHNYYVFSNVTLGTATFTRGYLGHVEVTDDIKLLDGIPIN